jgi:O-antigen ligase
LFLTKKNKYETLLFLSILSVAIIQWSFPWELEKRFSLNFFGLSLYVSEVFFLLVLLRVFQFQYLNKLNLNILIILLFGIFISFLSSFANNNPNWFINFLVSLDFYVYGIVMCLIRFNEVSFKYLKYLFLAYFLFIIFQQITVPTGIITIQTSNELKSAGGIYRVGTSIGSPIASGYFIFMMSGILFSLFPTHTKIKNLVMMLGLLGCIFTLSRGPILSFLILLFLYNIKFIRSNLLTFRTFIISALFLTLLNQINSNYNVIDIIQNRVGSENITSSRNIKWFETIEIFNENSFFFGAGSNIVPMQRSLLSNVELNKNLASSPHNFYLSFLVENGFFGLLLIIILMIKLFFSTLSLKNVNRLSKLTYLILFFTLTNLELSLRNGVTSFLFWFLFFYLINLDFKNSLSNLYENRI